MCEVGKEGGKKVGYKKLVADVKKKGVLWEDPEFPADDSSIYYSKKPVSGKIEWKRPSVSIN